MSLRPIDVTITLQRAPEATRTQTGENTRPEVAQQQFADRMEREVQHQDRVVIQTNKTEDNRVDRDGKRGGSGENARKKKQQQKDKPASARSGSGDSMFDMSV